MVAQLLSNEAILRIVDVLNSYSLYGPLAPEAIEELTAQLERDLRSHVEYRQFEDARGIRSEDNDQVIKLRDSINGAISGYAGLSPRFKKGIDFTIYADGYKAQKVFDVLSSIKRELDRVIKEIDEMKKQRKGQKKGQKEGPERRVALVYTVEKLSLIFREYTGKEPRMAGPNNTQFGTPHTTYDGPFLRFCAACLEGVDAINNQALAEAIRKGRRGEGPASSLLGLKRFPPY